MLLVVTTIRPTPNLVADVESSLLVTRRYHRIQIEIKFGGMMNQDMTKDSDSNLDAKPESFKAPHDLIYEEMILLRTWVMDAHRNQKPLQSANAMLARAEDLARYLEHLRGTV